MRSVRWARWADHYPIDIVATVLGVSVATARKYRRARKLPKSRQAAYLSLRQISVPNRQRIREILALHESVIEELTGESISTIRRWIKNKDIPVDKRDFLVQQFADEIEEREVVGPLIRFKESPNYLFYMITWMVNQPLTDNLIIDLVSMIDNYHLTTGSKAQLKITARAELNFMDEVLTYMIVEYFRSEDNEDINVLLEIFSTMQSTSSGLAKEASRLLLDLINRDAIVETIVILQRIKSPWSKKKGEKDE